MFDWEYGIVGMQCRGIEPHLSASGKSHGFSRGVVGTSVCTRVRAGVAIKSFVCSVTSGLLSSYDGHLRNLKYTWQDNTDASGGEAGDRGSLSIWHSDIGTPIHFQKESGIVTF